MNSPPCHFSCRRPACSRCPLQSWP
ncbi:MAG: hypothetical protein K8J31_25380 [Anaerolineae bacterium]|nr:hypothetical protein [Anaerolineae bacterium]